MHFYAHYSKGINYIPVIAQGPFRNDHIELRGRKKHGCNTKILDGAGMVTFEGTSRPSEIFVYVSWLYVHEQYVTMSACS